MKRVMIVGGPGSGKSTLARMLGEITGLPIFHMDHIHWKPGWVERTQDEKNHLTHEVHLREEWIFEGNHSRTYTERIKRADTLIWLGFPVALRLWRVLRRSVVSYGQNTSRYGRELSGEAWYRNTCIYSLHMENAS